MDPADLTALGLSQDAAESYMDLLAAGHRRAALEVELHGELHAVGLVGDPEPDGAARLNDPRRVLRAEARRRRRQADAALHLEHELGSLWDRPGAQGTDIIEVLHGRAAVQRVADTMQLSAVEQVRSMDRGPYAPSTAGQMCPVQRRQLPRGIRYQAVYSDEAVSDPAIRSSINEAVALGEEARVHASVPLRLRIIDEEIGLIVLIEGERVTGVVIHPSPMLDALIALFASVWSGSVPLGVADQAPLLTTESSSAGSVSSATPVSEEEAARELVGLMAAGVTDEQMARQMGISRRTLSRRIQQLLEATGSTTRFQLGVQAARRGWLV